MGQGKREMNSRKNKALGSVPRLQGCLPMLFLLAFGSCGGDPESSLDVVRIEVSDSSAFPWDPAAGAPSVPAYVNGSMAGRLLIDMGRKRSLLSQQVVQRLSLNVITISAGEFYPDGLSRVSCVLRFADVDARDWRPEVGEVPEDIGSGSWDIVGVIGADVLSRLELCLDPFVGEVRVLPEGGVARELAGFAADGWNTSVLPLHPLDGQLVLLAETSQAGEESALFAVRVSPAQPRSDMPAEYQLEVGGRFAPAESMPELKDAGVLGVDYLRRFLLGWDGPGLGLYLAEVEGLAENR
ncbi:MAG: hypothetical protein ACI8PQ_003514 [Planctomycetota bacterium]|jgi:hypothetical protein